ncbi:MULTISPECIES: exodeoxyribonuclease VII large subunit [unclassified Sphingobacterium]|uniref:exodeoxyribonuclease VII large subunit n=1 Tax=unclassified Sphingobacterium TaxID=2609468 RepID=UPI0010497D2D|nr:MULTISPECIES: exodeoxyribonuclease VII large subunit [unclassified Sphingobacterium]MCS3556638.1 exodeoxyribonuclease VII large subunit [Sphingobacterium sp. JUb21]TCQ99460.1 exodeoxyribonuclease VII large subunit [Sphingobacterium sp. JUb20]
MPEVVENRTIFSLLEVTRSIQKTIAERYKSLYWIKAEMNKLNHYSHSGHCYPELVEKTEGKIVAEIRSILWKADYQRINTQFLKIAQEPLREGITMLFQASISYDPMYGLSLRIVDIDPTFTLGELEKERINSINKLKKDGIFDLNRNLPFPTLPKRLAIISVETSKGLSDFYKIINQNPWGYKIEQTLYPALLQGDKSVPSIIKQLSVIADRSDAYDAVAIIRGGGGEVGLSSYNNYLLAKAIAIFPLPVLTGIGHSTNLTVSEMVAYKNAITPSELADFLIQKFHNFAIPLDQLTTRILQNTTTIFKGENEKLKSLASDIKWSSQRSIQQSKVDLNSFEKDLKINIAYIFRQKFTTLDHLEKMIQLADPVRLLKKGYSITQVNGELLVSVDQIKDNDILTTQVWDGEIISVTQKINKNGK